ncbi:MAG: cupin domain-containing protein, partial [Lentihominibacter sp.]
MIDKNQYRENSLIIHPPFGEKYENIAVQCSLCRQQMIHMHDCLEIIYVFRGRVEVKIAFEKNIMEAGEFFAVNQYEVHSIRAIDGEALIASIYISDKLLPVEKGFIVWWPEALKYDKGIYDKQAANIRNLVTQYASNTLERLIMLNVDNIIRVFQNELKVEAFQRNGSPGDYSESELKRIHSMYMYMYEHLDEKLSLEKMSSDFAMSPSYMSHYLKSV